MRILINDFGGYAFPIQLSKNLSKKGYQVIHTYLENIKTPHGNMDKGNIADLTIVPVILKKEFNKYNLFYRYLGEVEYANHVNRTIDQYKPDVVISGNTPLFAQNMIVQKCKKNQISFIYWCQDIHSLAIRNVLKRKLPAIGSAVNLFFKYLEVNLLKKSDHIISISNDFNKIFLGWGIESSKISTINNWGPIDEITLHNKCNNWSEKLGICNKKLVIYAGTLGLKHNPYLIIRAAKQLQSNPDVMFVVISEGLGASTIRKESRLLNLINIIVLDFQDYHELSLVLSSADILISILEEDAALYSVPSKVLTYLCSNKPIVLSVPSTNLTVQILENANAGLYTESKDEQGFINNIKILIDNEELRKTYGENGRRYAETNFKIDLITEKFMAVLEKM